MIKIKSHNDRGWVPEDVWEKIKEVYKYNQTQYFEFNFLIDPNCESFKKHGFDQYNQQWIRSIAYGKAGRNAWTEDVEPNDLMKDVL